MNYIQCNRLALYCWSFCLYRPVLGNTCCCLPLNRNIPRIYGGSLRWSSLTLLYLCLSSTWLLCLSGFLSLWSWRLWKISWSFETLLLLLGVIRCLAIICICLLLWCFTENWIIITLNRWLLLSLNGCGLWTSIVLLLLLFHIYHCQLSLPTW